MSNPYGDSRRFRKGAGCYTCIYCGKRTRDTGNGGGDYELCKRCLDKAGDENLLSDGTITQEEFDRKWGEL
jgi:hypothetical protein